jgi:hypothetical protein
MPYTEKGYRARAEECVRHANLTKDEMISSAILRLRQSYLEIATRLASLDSPQWLPAKQE